MSVVLGDRFRFAAEVGEPGPLCRVDLWAAGKWLTCDDNMAYVPAFRHGVLDTVARLRSGEGSPLPFAGLSAEDTHRRLTARAMDDAEAEAEADYEQRSRFQVLHWGPTTDNVIAHLFREKDNLVITLEFWREEHLRDHPEDAGAVFVVEIQVQEFVRILDGIVTALGTS
ncbi:hypothetical protein J3A78_007462 [Streptomyces sp. PvR006]|uniref:hypothetical protein n=1 Tax=Streptomyces sp. PvR006 TaxID=2817860 RepID=UPI001AE56ECF|nr:hypothetical protein [Streptomyces sp. PvR006]MBP2586984.1 hypothetical protein [Streptomyces sp. PvR006]